MSLVKHGEAQFQPEQSLSGSRPLIISDLVSDSNKSGVVPIDGCFGKTVDHLASYEEYSLHLNKSDLVFRFQDECFLVAHVPPEDAEWSRDGPFFCF